MPPENTKNVVPKTMRLHWFSGAGNTLNAAGAFAERLREKGWKIELVPIERAVETPEKPGNIRDFDHSAVMGLAFPTHCFSIPDTVVKFLSLLPKSPGTPAVMLGTHGAFSGGVRGMVKRKLSKKGFKCLAAGIISFPDSFFPFFGDETNRRHFARGIENARRYADDFDRLFSDGKTSWSRWPILSEIHGLIFGAFFASRKLVRPLHTSVHAVKSACTRCGTCVRNCPVGALSLKNDGGIPIAGMNCTNCLRCVALCPVDAMRHLVGFRPYRSEPTGELAEDFEKALSCEKDD